VNETSANVNELNETHKLTVFGPQNLDSLGCVFRLITDAIYNFSHCINYKLNSVAIVRKRTIPAERPPLVGEVSANLCG
jgi:hypothetical protein